MPIGRIYAIIIPMARRINSVAGTEVQNKRFTESLQYHSKLLFEADEELKRATRAKSEFVSKISHEFRTSLNIILGFTELLLDEVPGRINAEQRRSLNDIHASSKHLIKLVDEYLDNS